MVKTQGSKLKPLHKQCLTFSQKTPSIVLKWIFLGLLSTSYFHTIIFLFSYFHQKFRIGILRFKNPNFKSDACLEEWSGDVCDQMQLILPQGENCGYTTTNVKKYGFPKSFVPILKKDPQYLGSKMKPMWRQSFTYYQTTPSFVPILIFMAGYFIFPGYRILNNLIITLCIQDLNA